MSNRINQQKSFILKSLQDQLSPAFKGVVDFEVISDHMERDGDGILKHQSEVFSIDALQIPPGENWGYEASFTLSARFSVLQNLLGGEDMIAALADGSISYKGPTEKVFAFLQALKK